MGKISSFSSISRNLCSRMILLPIVSSEPKKCWYRFSEKRVLTDMASLSSQERHLSSLPWRRIPEHSSHLSVRSRPIRSSNSSLGSQGPISGMHSLQENSSRVISLQVRHSSSSPMVEPISGSIHEPLREYSLPDESRSILSRSDHHQVEFSPIVMLEEWDNISMMKREKKSAQISIPRCSRVSQISPVDRMRMREM